MAQHQVVTLVNRTNKILQGTWDGRHHEIPPGESRYTMLEAEAFRRQNPVPGSGDPRHAASGMTGKMEYKIGIKECNHPCDPIEIDPNAKERWDRSKLIGAKPTEYVAGDNGIYSARDVASGPMPTDSNFTRD